MTVWNGEYLVEGKIKLMPYLAFGNARVLRVANPAIGEHN